MQEIIPVSIRIEPTLCSTATSKKEGIDVRQYTTISIENDRAKDGERNYVDV